MDPNSHDALVRRRDTATLTWRGPALMLFARTALAVPALIPVSLLFIFGGIYGAGWVMYGTLKPPYLFGSLPMPAAL
jgi:hypothetical protein